MERSTHTSNLKTIVLVWVMLALVMVSQFQLAACQQGYFPAYMEGKVLDPNNTMQQLAQLASMIDTTQDYYPGLVAFLKWQDPLKNLTVLGRVLLWTPDCSMEAKDGEYTLSGGLVSDIISWILATNTDFHKLIEEGAPWATMVQDNLWLDYFSQFESEETGKLNSHLLPVRSSSIQGNNAMENDCVPYNHTIDSLLSDTNGLWGTLYPRQFIMSTDRKHIVEMQLDCNLVVYTFPDRKPKWASNTYLAGTNCKAVMQGDGNLVVYNGNGTSLWSSQSYIENYVGNFRFTMQKDGLAVVYNMESGQILWASYRYGL